MRVTRITFIRHSFHEHPIDVGCRKWGFTPFGIDNNQKIVISRLTNTTHYRYSRQPLGFNALIMDICVVIKRSPVFLPPIQEDTVVETAFSDGKGFLDEGVLWIGMGVVKTHKSYEVRIF